MATRGCKSERGILVSICLIVCSLILATSSQDTNTDQYMHRLEEHFLEFPMIKEDMVRWFTTGSAVLQKNFATIVPEVQDRAGFLVNFKPVNSTNWVFDFTVQVGNEENNEEATEGFAIYYFKEFARADPKILRYVINKPFNGFGVVFDTYVKTPGMPPETNKVYAISNDGTKENMDPFTDHIAECAAMYKTFDKVNLRLRYEDSQFTLYTKLNGETDYKECMNVANIDLSYNGYLAVVASNGSPFADYVNIYSIESFDPKERDQTSTKSFKEGRRMGSFDFSKSKASDTLHKYGEREVKDKSELIKTVNRESKGIDRYSKFLTESLERHFSQSFSKLPKQTDMNELANALSGISMSISRVKDSLESKINGLVTEQVNINMAQTGSHLQSDCPYVFGMGCKLKNTVDNLNKKLGDLTSTIDKSNANKHYNAASAEAKKTIKGDEGYKTNKEFKNFAMDYSKRTVDQEGSSSLDYILYISFIGIVGFSAYVIFGKSDE